MYQEHPVAARIDDEKPILQQSQTAWDEEMVAQQRDRPRGCQEHTAQIGGTLRHQTLPDPQHRV
jgi:hypothetical protein